MRRNFGKVQNNKVRTTRYTILSWLPLSLLVQFKRVANIYFLIISVLTLMPFSPKSPVSMIGTFSFVLLLTMVKEAVEDVYRHRADREANSKTTHVFSFAVNRYERRTWQEIEVGELIRVEKDEPIPCDLLLLYADNADGIAFVDTSSLDGETNLKEKLSPFLGPSEREIQEMNGRVYFDKPNARLDDWNAELMGPSFDRHVFADISNLLLRGCTLKNTNWVLGVSINLGNRTKLMMNQKKVKGKVSDMMKKMNRLLYSVFLLQMLIIVAFASLST